MFCGEENQRNFNAALASWTIKSTIKTPSDRKPPLLQDRTENKSIQAECVRGQRALRTNATTALSSSLTASKHTCPVLPFPSLHWYSTLLDSSQRSRGVTLITERWQPTVARWAEVTSWKTSAAGAGKRHAPRRRSLMCFLSRRGNLTGVGKRQTRTSSLGVKGQAEEIRTDRSQANNATFSRPHQQKTAGREMQKCNASTPQHRKYAQLKE